MMNFWIKLKTRWGINNDWQVLVILIVFALTGTTTMYLHRLIDLWIGIDNESSFWLKLLTFLILVIPLYNILLILYGALFGQYHFFKAFVIRFFKGLSRLGK